MTQSDPNREDAARDPSSANPHLTPSAAIRLADGAESGWERDELEAHVQACDACAALVARYRSIILAAARLVGAPRIAEKLLRQRDAASPPPNIRLYGDVDWPSASFNVLAFLTTPLLDHLRVVLERHHEHVLTAFDDWSSFECAVREASWDAVVADPCAEGVLRTSELVALIEAYPSTPLTLYTRLEPGTLRSIAELARLGGGAHQIVLYRFDDTPNRFLELLEKPPAHMLSDQLLRRLTPGLELLAPPLARMVERLIRRPYVFVKAADLAASTQSNVRAVHRQLAAAGFGPPRALIVGSRLLRAYAYARDPTQSVEDVASRAGYRAPGMLARHMREVLGMSLRDARRRIPTDEFVSTLAARLWSAPKLGWGSAPHYGRYSASR